MNWRQRSYEKELLDDQSNPFEEIRVNMKELDTINHWLGGHAITLQGMRKLAGMTAKRSGRTPISVCEIGCGGGDNLRVIRDWARKQGIQVELTGIDINPSCIRFATGRLPEARFIESDYRLVIFEENPDIIFSSLFCHHFNDDELVDQLKWMRVRSRTGFFINDLHRHRLAWLSIKILTGLLSRSRLVKNDAPLSVQRGFSKAELNALLLRSGISEYFIHWKWAFRWLVTVPR